MSKPVTIIKRIDVKTLKDKVVLDTNAGIYEVIGFSKVGDSELSIDTDRGGVTVKGSPDRIEKNFKILMEAFRQVSQNQGVRKFKI